MPTDLVILDEPGYLPSSQAGGALLFHLISKVYEKTSVIIPTNLSFWGCDIDQAMDKLNNRPRKCLDMKTPNQVFIGINLPVAFAS